MATFSFKVEDNNFNDFKEAFLAKNPNITVGGETPMTDGEWIKHRIKLLIRNEYLKGKIVLFNRQNKPTQNPDVVVEI